MGGYNTSVRQVIKRRFQQLMIPFLCWSVIKYAISGDIIHCWKCILMPTDTFWFLWALFFIVVVFSIFDKLSQLIKVKQELVIGLVCILCAGVMIILKDIRVFGLQYILYYFLFYSLGYYMRKYDLLVRRVPLVILLLLLWFLLGSFWKPRELPDFVHVTGTVGTMLKFAYKFIVAFVAVIGMFSFSALVLNKKGLVNDAICKLGTISLGIYTFHYTVVNIFVNTIRHFITPDWGIVVISFVVLSIVSYFVVWIIGRNKWTARFLLGKF